MNGNSMGYLFINILLPILTLILFGLSIFFFKKSCGHFEEGEKVLAKRKRCDMVFSYYNQSRISRERGVGFALGAVFLGFVWLMEVFLN